MANIVEIIVQTIDRSRAGMDSAQDSAEDLGKGISSSLAVGAAAMAGLGLAAAAMGQQIFKAMDIEAANDKMAAQLGMGAESSKYYGELAGSLYSQAYGDSLSDVNDALVATNQNIGEMAGDSEDAFENATKAGMDFAAVFDEDISEASRAAGIMIKNGLAKDAQEAFDILTVGMQNGANAGDDLLDTFSEYSPKFAELGVDGTKAMGMISQAMKAGARDSDFVADAIKEFSIRSKDASKTSLEAFDAIGLGGQKMTAIFAKGGPEADAAMALVIQKLKEMKDPVAQNAAAVALFGTKAEDLGKTLYAIDPTTAVKGLGEVAGAAKKMGDTMADNAATRFEAFKRTIETNVSNFIGEKVLPKVLELADVAGPAMARFQESAARAFEWVAGKPEAIAAVAASVGVVLVAAFGALGVAAWSAAAGVIAATWPVLAIGAAVAGLAALLMYAWNNWDTFREVITTVATTLQGLVAPAIDFVKMCAEALWQTALEPMVNYILANSEAFGNLGKILLVIAGIIIGTVVVALVAAIAVLLLVVAGAALVVTAVVAIIAVLYNFAQILWDVIGVVRDWLGGVLDAVENVIQIFWDMANNVGTAIANVIRAIWNCMQVVWDLAKNVGSAIADCVRFFWDLPGKIQSAVGDLGSLLVGAGRAILDGLVRGFESALGWAKGKISDGLGAIRNLFPHSPAKEGPFSGSGYTDTSGAKLMEDFGKGAAGKASATAARMAAALGEVASPFNVPGSVTAAARAAWAGSQPGAPGGTTGGITFKGDTDGAFATAFMALVRSGQIQIDGGVF